MKFLHFSLHTIVLFYTLSFVWSTEKQHEAVDEGSDNSRSLIRRTRQNICVATSHKSFKVRNVSKSKVDILLKEKDGMKGTCNELCDSLCDERGVKKVTTELCECTGSSKCGKDKIHDASGNCIPMRRPPPTDEPPITAGCAATSCTINSDCIEDDNGVAECVCMKQYAFDDNGQCVPIQCTKLDIKCGDYEICGVNDDAEPTCECIPGYEKNTDDICAPVLFPGCAAILCVTNTVCVEGDDGQAECLCAEEYGLDVDTGMCVPVECTKQDIICKGLEICTLSFDGTVGCECGPGSIITSDGACVENPCNLMDCQENYVCILTDEGEGMCVEDKCALVRCKQNTECINTEDGADCQCLLGFIDTPDMGCITSCAAVRCGGNTECVVSSEGIAECLCIDGYVPDSDDFCTKTDGIMPGDRPGCAAVTCPTNTECIENSNGAGECVEVLPPGCALILCVPNTICVEAANDIGAECKCAKGYETNDDNGLCLPVECKEQDIACEDPLVCVLSADDGTTATCGCYPGFELTPDGECTIVDSAACAAVSCPINTVCIDEGDGSASCPCADGFEFNEDGQCIKIKK